METMNECKGVGLTSGGSERHVLEMARKTSKEEVTINSGCSTELELEEGRYLSKGHSYYFMSWSCQVLQGCFVISGFREAEEGELFKISLSVREVD